MGKRTRWFGILGALVMAGGFGASSAAAQPSISVGTATGNPGDTVTVTVSLVNGGGAVAGIDNDLSFQANAPVAFSMKGNCTITTTTQCTTSADCPPLPDVLPGACANDATKSCKVDGDCTGGTCTRGNEPCVNVNAPDCDVNPAIGKGGFFSFQPTVCSNDATKVCTTSADCTNSGTCTAMCSGATCTGIRALILAVNNTTAISPDNADLYTCKVTILGTAVAGDYALTVPKVSMGDTAFHAIAGVTGTPGKVTVGGVTPTTFEVCDVAPSTGSAAGQFGNGSLNIADVKAIFKAAQFGGSFLPPAGSALFSAMDAVTVDSVPACGGNGSLNIADVKKCFQRAQFAGQANFTRTGTGASCVSAQK